MKNTVLLIVSFFFLQSVQAQNKKVLFPLFLESKTEVMEVLKGYTVFRDTPTSVIVEEPDTKGKVRFSFNASALCYDISYLNFNDQTIAQRFSKEQESILANGWSMVSKRDNSKTDGNITYYYKKDNLKLTVVFNESSYTMQLQ